METVNGIGTRMIIAAGAETVGGDAVVYVLSADSDGECFGIAVSKVRADGKVSESSYVRNLTGDRSFAERVFELVRRGTVTPCVLGEVIEDLVGA